MAALLPSALQAGQQTLSLAEAVAQALERNPELAVDAPGSLAAQAELEASRAVYLPRVDFELNYSGGNNPVYVFGTLLSQRRFTEANFNIQSLNRPDALDNVQTRFTAQQTIWDFGRSQQRRRQAHLGLEAVEHGNEQHRRQVMLAVIQAYYGVSLAREAWEAAGVALRSAEAIASQAESRVESGLAVEADRLRSQANLAAARAREIQARGELETALAVLNRLMGNALDAPLPETARLSPADLPIPDEDSLLAEQRERRTDYQLLLTEISQAESQLSSRKAEYYPVVSGFAAWETDNPSFVTAGGNNWLAGVSLRWNIFAGGSDSAQIQAATHRLEQKRRQLAALESALRLEIRNALVQTRSSEEQVQVAQAAEKQSEESLRILRNRYDAGLATMTDILSAETSRAAARIASAEAVYRHRLSYAQLEYAAGVLSPTSTAMKP